MILYYLLMSWFISATAALSLTVLLTIMCLFVFRYREKIKCRLLFRWYDVWVGGYWDEKRRMLFIVLVPMVVIEISLIPKVERDGYTSQTVHEL